MEPAGARGQAHGCASLPCTWDQLHREQRIHRAGAHACIALRCSPALGRERRCRRRRTCRSSQLASSSRSSHAAAAAACCWSRTCHAGTHPLRSEGVAAGWVGLHAAWRVSAARRAQGSPPAAPKHAAPTSVCDVGAALLAIGQRRLPHGPKVRVSKAQGAPVKAGPLLLGSARCAAIQSCCVRSSCFLRAAPGLYLWAPLVLLRLLSGAFEAGAGLQTTASNARDAGHSHGRAGHHRWDALGCMQVQTHTNLPHLWELHERCWTQRESSTTAFNKQAAQRHLHAIDLSKSRAAACLHSLVGQ